MYELVDFKRSWVDVNFLSLIQVKRIIGDRNTANFVHIGSFNGALDKVFMEEMRPVVTTIHAIEPCRANLKMLKAVQKVYPNYKPLRALIGETDGVGTIYTQNSSQANSLYEEFLDGKNDEKLGQETLQMLTMNTLFKELNLKSVDMLRINCEGGEYKIFSENADLSFLKIVKVLFLAVHGKTREFLSENIVNQKIAISNSIKEYGFRQIYGFKFDKNIEKTPIGHINQIWIK